MFMLLSILYSYLTLDTIDQLSSSCQHFLIAENRQHFPVFSCYLWDKMFFNAEDDDHDFTAPGKYVAKPSFVPFTPELYSFGGSILI